MGSEALIDRIEPFALGWQRSSGTKNILQLVEDAQDDLFDYDSPGMIFRPSDNKGFEPYLITQDTVYEYEIKAVNLGSALTKTLNGTAYDVRCRRALRVFVDVTRNDYNLRYMGEAYPYSIINPYSSRGTERITMADIPCEFTPPTELDPAKVIFQDNPGATTTTFFIQFVWEPPRLTAETVPLVVPQGFYQGIIEYAIGQIQFFANGKYNDMMSKWEQYWKPRFRAETSWTPGGAGTQVEPLVC